jgi:hypothetical protein
VEFTPYMSYRLHWSPYEITRGARLNESSVSTRALYGNHKFRPPFPRLAPPQLSTAGLDLDNLLPEQWGAVAITTCSVLPNAPLSKAFSGEVGTGSSQKVRQATNPDHALPNVIGTWSGAAESLVLTIARRPFRQ